MAAWSRALSSRITRAERAAVAATQIIATGRKIAISVMRKRRLSNSVSPPVGSSIIVTKSTDPPSHSSDRTKAVISVPVSRLRSGRS